MLNKKIASAAMSAFMAMAMTATSFAAGVAADGPAAGLNGGKSENTIPVQISADATVFDVTVPTAFPVTMDPTTGAVTPAENTTITNNSYGSIKVSNIKVNKAGDWKLAAYDTDMSKEEVDANKIGVQVTPKGGAKGGTGTALATTDADANTQTLLDDTAGTAAEWIINGKDATDQSNELTVLYNANASAVSQAITNATVANIVVTVSWNA